MVYHKMKFNEHLIPSLILWKNTCANPYDKFITLYAEIVDVIPETKYLANMSEPDPVEYKYYDFKHLNQGEIRIPFLMGWLQWKQNHDRYTWLTYRGDEIQTFLRDFCTNMTVVNYEILIDRLKNEI